MTVAAGRLGRTVPVIAILALVLSGLVASAVWGAVNAHAATGTALARTGWTATASVSNPGEPASNILDGNSASRWSTGTAMTDGQAITVDMATTRSVDEITMDSAGSSGDYAREYEVFVSTDGSTWEPLLLAWRARASLHDAVPGTVAVSEWTFMSDAERG